MANYYADDRELSLVRHEGDPHVYQRNKDSDSKGRKLYYLGDNTFGYERFPMDRIVFTVGEQGQVLAYNPFWNGLKGGGLYRRVR